MDLQSLVSYLVILFYSSYCVPMYRFIYNQLNLLLYFTETDLSSVNETT